MSNFKVIYKVLKTLDRYKGREDFDISLISADAMKISFEEWEQIIIEMAECGYIRGVVYDQTLTDQFPHIEEPMRPRITMSGMEFLENNGTLAKAKETLRMAGEIL